MVDFQSRPPQPMYNDIRYVNTIIKQQPTIRDKMGITCEDGGRGGQSKCRNRK